MPRKIRQLRSDLRAAKFKLDRQSGSHQQFKHSNFPGVVTVSGADGDDAKRYLERQVAEAIAKSRLGA